jgi:hypothetical protein
MAHVTFGCSSYCLPAKGRWAYKGLLNVVIMAWLIDNAQVAAYHANAGGAAA